MRRLTRKNIVWSILILLFFSFVTFIFLQSDNNDIASSAPICPDDYPDTDEGSNMRIADTDVWTNTFFDNNPDATVEDWSEARRKFWMENNCTLALERYEAAISGEADMSDVDAIVNDVLSE